MKTTNLLTAAILLAAVVAMGQTPPANSQTPNPNQAPNAPAPAKEAPTVANPKAKRQPTPKTKQEYDAYEAAMKKPDAPSTEAAARDFEAQFPGSELIPLVYQQALNKYKMVDNDDKALDMGRKVLQYEPDNVFALVLNATVLAERTRSTDIDREPRLKEATDDAQHALEDIRTGNYLLNAAATPEQVEQFKSQVSAMAYSALGKAEMERENYAAAEQNLRKAADLPTGKSDAITWYRLALALDHQKKYAEANDAIAKAVALAPANSQVATLAAQEQARLKQLAESAGTAAPNEAPKSGNQPQPEAVPSK